jgi:hypothetical protein
MNARVQSPIEHAHFGSLLLHKTAHFFGTLSRARPEVDRKALCAQSRCRLLLNDANHIETRRRRQTLTIACWIDQSELPAQLPGPLSVMANKAPRRHARNLEENSRNLEICCLRPPAPQYQGIGVGTMERFHYAASPSSAWSNLPFAAVAGPAGLSGAMGPVDFGCGTGETSRGK